MGLIVNQDAAGSNPAPRANTLLSSSGQETRFSSGEREFNSPKQRQFFT
jgi:hypothetical protein